ncbi:unnamed protein product [marine sediment metagenome]|uniref:Uncharacterized protein n=1 Tax=marine sediment metagenome TaxID=412755 RepID=X0YZM7_9ZZZZ
MVKIIDLVEKKLIEEKRNEKISNLLKEVFGDEVEITGFNLNKKENKGFIGSFDYLDDAINLRDAGYESKAVEFGERYEKEIGLLYPNINPEFIIKTNYS